MRFSQRDQPQAPLMQADQKCAVPDFFLFLELERKS